MLIFMNRNIHDVNICILSLTLSCHRMLLSFIMTDEINGHILKLNVFIALLYFDLQ